MRSLRAARKRPKACGHHEVVASVVAGIERMVCKDCDHVTFRYWGESVTRSGVALQQAAEGLSNIALALEPKEANLRQPETMLTTREAAAEMGVHINTIYRKMDSLGGLKVGREWRIPAENIHGVSDNGSKPT